MKQNLLEETKSIIKKYNLQINPSLDQHFLIDESVVKSIQKALDPDKDDILLEIGSGVGNVTKELVINKAIIVEIDKQLHPVLEEQLVGKHYTLIKKSAYKYLQDQLEIQKNLEKKQNTTELQQFNKIYSNLPFTAAESIFILLPKTNFKIAVFIMPEDFFNNVISNIIYEAFFDIEVVQNLECEMFYPVPDAKLLLVKITKAEESKDYVDFIIRELYLQNDKKLKNALREVLILFFDKYLKKKTTKNDVRQIIGLLNLNKELLDADMNKISIEQFKQIIENFVEHVKENYDLHRVKPRKLNQ